MYGIFNDYNDEYFGVMLDDYIECRTLIQKKVLTFRQATKTSFTNGTDNQSFFKDLGI